jgi:hypothetical protein
METRGNRHTSWFIASEFFANICSTICNYFIIFLQALLLLLSDKGYHYTSEFSKIYFICKCSVKPINNLNPVSNHWHVSWNTLVIYIVIWRLKARIVEQKEAAVSVQWCGKRISTAKNKHATTEEPWKRCFPLGLSQGYIVKTTIQLKQQSEFSWSSESWVSEWEWEPASHPSREGMTSSHTPPLVEEEAPFQEQLCWQRPAAIYRTALESRESWVVLLVATTNQQLVKT